MDNIEVVNPEKLPSEIPCRRIDDFGLTGMKPNIVKLENGELLLANFHSHSEAQKDGSICEHTMLHRSSDGGMTWTSLHHEELLGREPYLNHFKGDIVMMTTHVLPGEVRNKRKMTHAVLHRSEDGGMTWESSAIRADDASKERRATTTRNIFELDDGRYILGVGYGYGEEYLYVSYDKGKSWKAERSCTKGISAARCEYYVFEEGVFFTTDSGRLMMLARSNLNFLDISVTIPGIPEFDVKGTGSHDHYDIEILYESKDGGYTWEPVKAVQLVSCMYPSVCSLGGDLYLLTVTIRTVHGGNSMGVQAMFMEEKPDGDIVFHESSDRIIIDRKTPSYLQSGGGFGNTIRLDDGTLLTPYSYYRADEETTELMISGRFMEEGIFEKMRRNAEKYNKWAGGFSWESVRKGPDDLQRHCFLGSAEIMRHCGAKTELAIWRMPALKNNCRGD